MHAEREINLLPLRFRQRAAARRILTSWGRVAAAMLLACGIQIALVYHHHRTARQQVAVLQERSRPAVTSRERQAALQARQEELRGLRGRLDALIPSDDLLQTLGAIATATAASETPDARLQALRIDLSGAPSLGRATGPRGTNGTSGTNGPSGTNGTSGANGTRGATAQPTARTASSATHVAFTAIARDEVSLSGLISRLRQNPRFQDVRLRSTSEDNAIGGRRADIEAAVLVEKELPQ